jgi:uncharacterized hydrophobic protein (TIGR00271 family)
MTLLRCEIHAAAGEADAVESLLVRHPYTMNVTRLRGVSIDPAGDVVSCDVPRETASDLLERLEQIGATQGVNSVTVTSGLTHLGARADSMEAQARGAASDALVWKVVEDTLDEEIHISITFIAFMILATLLAVIGVATNSAILVVGAMVVGPEFGPIANFCVSVLNRQILQGIRAWLTVTVGFAIAGIAAFAFTVVVRAAGIFPEQIQPDGLVEAVASPNWLTLIVAMLAGSAGMLALTSARSATLIGVLISVTTIPAMGDAAVLLAYGDIANSLSALLTLGINLTGMSAAGVATLAMQRSLMRRINRVPQV